MTKYFDTDLNDWVHVVETPEDIHSLKWNLYLEFTCKQCGKTARFRFSRQSEPRYNTFLCTECHSKKTFNERYGSDWYMGTKDFINKSKETNLKLRGCEYASQSKEFRDKFDVTIRKKEEENPNVWKENYAKAMETYKERTGYDHPLRNPEGLAKCRQSCKETTGFENPLCAENRENIKQIWVDMYGVDNPMKVPEIHAKAVESYKDRTGYEYSMQNPEAKAKAVDTWTEHYGVDHPMKSEEIKAKNREIWIEHYGVDNPMKASEVQNRAKETNLEKYGTEYASQSPEVKEQSRQTSMEHWGAPCYLASQANKDDLISRFGAPMAPVQKIWFMGQYFDSLWEVAVYWYCVCNGIPIVRNPYGPQGGIPYEITLPSGETKTYHYYPDFWINGEIVEVKGNQLLPNENGQNVYDVQFCKDDDINKIIARLKTTTKIKKAKELGIRILTSTEIKPYVDWFNSWLGLWNYNRAYHSIGKRMAYKIPNYTNGVTPFDIKENEEYVMSNIPGATPFDGLLSRVAYKVSL